MVASPTDTEARTGIATIRDGLIWPDNEEMKKLDVDASRMDEEWAKRPMEVIRYCLRDTYLP